jgi:magnesium transporter
MTENEKHSRIEAGDLPEKLEELKTFFSDSHPADIAELMNKVDAEAAIILFSVLDAETKADVFPDLNESQRGYILVALEEHELVPIVSEMESDDAADLVQDLQDLDEETAQSVMDRLQSDQRHEVEQLLDYPDDTAGGVMALEVVAVGETMTVDQAIQQVRELAEEREIEDIYVVYVVDDGYHLIGHVSLQALLLAVRGQMIREIMDTEIVSVNAVMDQEQVAATARKYDLASIPVVDSANVLLGRVTMDDVYDIVEEEAAEDIAHLAGTDEEVLEHSSLVVVGERLPWLLVGLTGGLISAFVLSFFKADLQTVLEATFFVPVVMGMGGNVGIQSSTIVVRGLATGELEVGDLWQRSWKESKVSFLVSLICSLILLGVIWIWMGDVRTAIVIGIALAMVIVQASIVGAVVPLILKKRGVDPAIATGPFITTSNDILGLGVYMLLIRLFLT